MEVIEILREASNQIYQNVKDLAGTEDAAGDFGRGAGGDISRNIDIVAEKTVLDYLKKINFECIVLGEECGRVELSDKPKGYIIMDAIDGSANAVRGVPFFCSSLAFATENKLSSITDGVITDLTNGDMYWASKNKGSFFNEKQIKVQQKEPIYKIVGINTSGGSNELMKRMYPIFQNHNHTRHFGANALEMALFARGLMDVFIDFRDKIRIPRYCCRIYNCKRSWRATARCKFESTGCRSKLWNKSLIYCCSKSKNSWWNYVTN